MYTKYCRPLVRINDKIAKRSLGIHTIYCQERCNIL